MPSASELGLQVPGRLGGEEAVVAGVVALHRGLQRRPVRLGVGPRDEAVPGHHRAERLGQGAPGHEREPAAHAEAGDAELGPGDRLVPLEEGDRPAQVLDGPVEVQRHHQLAGLVRLGGALAVEEVRRQGHEALGGEAVAEVGDVGHEPPPLLDDHQAGAGPARRTAR